MYFSKNNPCKAGKYFRLSREDGDRTESDSIRNQRELVNDYISQHPDIISVDEYVDDGYTGTNFERPGFQKMLHDIESKKINCIIVKDLSRLGRNYIEVGRYLEKIFPLKGIRFIAINDHYDSFNDNGDADQIIIPFKNLINDAYCRDISVKVRSQLDVKRKNGQFIGSFASYGYRKDPEDKNHLLVDEEAAEIVRLIFGMRLEGYSAKRIAEKLNEMKVATPFEYKRSHGFNFNSGFHTGNDPKWSAVNVLRILKNELYTGVLVQGRYQKINYKVKQFREVDEADWIRVEGTHDAIISREVFDNVQELMQRDTRTAPSMDCVYPLSGYVRCPDCGQNMIRRTAKSHGKVYHYYHCSTYSNGDGCSAHLINEQILNSTVLAMVNMQISLLMDAELMAEKADMAQTGRPGIRAIDTQLTSLREEADRYQDLCVKLYQDMHNKIISSEEYQNLNDRFMEKIQNARRAVKELEQKRKRVMSVETADRPWMKMFQKYQGAEQIDRQMVVSLIDRIVVHDKKHVEIVFRYGDEMGEFLNWYREMVSEEEVGQEADRKITVMPLLMPQEERAVEV